MATGTRCACGKAIVGKFYKDLGRCKACEEKRKQDQYAEAQRIVATGKCPCCGTSLERNLALTGWWQCGAYGVDYMRKPEHRKLPACSFQTFTK